MESIQSLSIAQISGLIALGTSLVAITLPLLIGVVLLRYLNRSTTAATWSVIARQLHSSKWPSILRTDSATFAHVEKRVVLIGLLASSLSLLNIIAGVVTPLGLHEEVAIEGRRDVDFRYVPDETTFGRAFGVRPDLPLSRNCTLGTLYDVTLVCPGANATGVSYVNGTASSGINMTDSPEVQLSTRIPDEIVDFFSSGTSNSTIANIFNIQFRSWRPQRSPSVENGTEYIVGLLRPVESLILRQNITMVEGLVADMKDGGVGYRNHSAPSQTGLESSWQEDILWIEPEITCVDTNLSLRLTGSGAYTTAGNGVKSVHIVDEGGFTHLGEDNPLNKPWPSFNQSAPNISERLNRTVWEHNYLLAIALNLTGFNDTSHLSDFGIGSEVQLVAPGEVNITGLDDVGSILGLSSLPPSPWSQYFRPSESLFRQGIPPVRKEDNGTYSALLPGTDGVTITMEDYPHLIAYDMLGELSLLCGGNMLIGQDRQDLFRSSCGYFLPVPRRVDGGIAANDEEDSQWKTNIQICGSAPKASVRTVSMSFQGPGNLAGLSAPANDEKSYTSKEDMPLWAMEDWTAAGKEGAQGGALWGIVGNNVTGTPGYNFTRSPSFYLPSLQTFRNPMVADDILAGTRAAYDTMSNLWVIFGDDTVATRDSYSGRRSAALRSLWEELGNSPNGSETILKLIWTDIMASYTLGTNSRSSPANGMPPRGTVVTYARRVSYHLPYAVPAIILLLFWILLLLRALISVALHRPVFQNLKELLNDTSVGRTAAVVHTTQMASNGTLDSDVSPAVRNLHAPSKQWLSAVGPLRFRLSSGLSNVEKVRKTGSLRRDGSEENLNGGRERGI